VSQGHVPILLRMAAFLSTLDTSDARSYLDHHGGSNALTSTISLTDVMWCDRYVSSISICKIMLTLYTRLQWQL